MNQIEKTDTSWKNKALFLGAVIGALTGVGTAYFLIKNAEREGESLSLSSGQGLKLGLLILGTLRQVMQLDDGQSKGKKR